MHTRSPLLLRSGVLTSSFVALCLATAASADDFTYSNSGTTWNTAAAWTPSGVPTGGNTYIVSNGHVLRTDATTGSTFGGGTLSLLGQLNLQSTTTGVNATHTANIVTSAGSLIVNARSTTTHTLAGTMQLGTGSTFLKSSGTNATTGDKRNITFTTLISGGTGATAHFLRNGDFTLSNAGNTFAGTWRAGGSASMVVDGVTATVSNSSDVISTIKATTAGSLGINTSVTLDAWSRFDADFDWTTTGALTLANNAGNASSIIVTLDQDITVGLLSIAGTTLTAGEYDYADLVSAGFGDYFTNGIGSITVGTIPEPSTYAALLGLASLALATRASRRKS
ncbi:MAG: hypothetical protein K0R17_1167 [Rariglobus sp.]|jgi:hypothetical protein|nr:hypothetical protein [Rariglobus sp.]